MSNLTQEEIDRAKKVQELIEIMQDGLDAYRSELIYIQSCCSHDKLPVRELGTEYRDTCPDCGYVRYCYAIG